MLVTSWKSEQKTFLFPHKCYKELIGKMTFNTEYLRDVEFDI